MNEVLHELLREPAGEKRIAELANRIWRERRGESTAGHQPLSDEELDGIAELYRRQGSASRARHHLLRLLAAERTPAALDRFALLMAVDPPGDEGDVALAFVPLFESDRYDARPLFPRLLGALEYPHVAVAVLDLANYLTRTGRVARHPATERSGHLAALLGGLVARLEQLERDPAAVASSAGELAAQVNQSVGLFIALCDAVALVGERSVVGTLRGALELGHRRLRAEAAAALGRLGEEAGIETLVQLTAEPVVRNCAIAYLDELGHGDRVAEQYRTATARAESELAAWLAEPTQLGAAPHELDLVDARTLRWPGYDETVDCFLFRYRYELPRGEMAGVGIVGPLTISLWCDLADLPPTDIYAAYAGWYAEHEEISETPADELGPGDRHEAERALAKLDSDEYTDVRLVKVGRFFGDPMYVATAIRSGQPGTVVVEQTRPHWYPQALNNRPPGPDEAYDIHKGRKLLGTFNANWGQDVDDSPSPL